MPIEYYYNLAEGDKVEAFILTIKYGDYDAFEKLLSLQKDINITDNSESDWTPLMHAVLEESFKMVQKLVEAGANVNIRAIEPYTDEFALNIAAYGCCSASSAYEYNRNKEIYDYLLPLTSPELKYIAKKSLNSRTDITFDY